MMTLLRSRRTRQSRGACHGGKARLSVRQLPPWTVRSSVWPRLPKYPWETCGTRGWRCYQSSRRTLPSWSKSVFANCCSIPLGLCNCAAPCAFRLQLKTQCEDCIHLSKGPVMCESQWARARPACDCLLFQLFPRLTLWVGEKVVCMCMCLLVWRWGVCVSGGGVEVRWRDSGL